MGGSGSVGPPAAPLALSAAALVMSVAAAVVSMRVSTSASDLVPFNPAGWGLALVAILGFVWFRSSLLAVQGDRYYVIPSWNPPRVAAVIAGLAWVVSIWHAYAIAEALARQ